MNGKSQKKENLLNLSLDATEAEREKSPALQMGYDQNTKRWELIIQYNGTVEKLQEQLPQAEIYPLSGGYAIVRLPESQVDDLAGLSQVEYIEKPKRLYFEVNRAVRDTCIAPVQSGNQVSQNVYGRDADLSGRGTLTAIIDSIDYSIRIFETQMERRASPHSGIRSRTGFIRGRSSTGHWRRQPGTRLRDRPVAGCERARDGSCGDCSWKWLGGRRTLPGSSLGE